MKELITHDTTEKMDQFNFLEIANEIQIKIRNLIHTAHNFDFTEKSADIVKFACLNELNYITIMFVIQKCIDREDEKGFRGYLLKKLVVVINDQLNSFPDACTPFSDLICYSKAHGSHIEISSWIRSILSTRTPSLGDIHRLMSTYQSETSSSVDFLRNPSLLDILVCDVYGIRQTEGSHSSRADIDKKLWLLAYASTATNNSINQVSFNKCLASLKALHTLLDKLTTATDMRDDFLSLLEAVDDPVTCHALLEWIDSLISDPVFYEADMRMQVNPPLLDLLIEIAIRRPFYRQRVLEVLSKNMVRDYSAMSSIRDRQFVLRIRNMFLEHLVLLMKTGFVIPVCIFIATHQAKIDDPLVLSFVGSVLSIIEIPTTDLVNLYLLKILKNIDAPQLLKEVGVNKDITSYCENTIISTNDEDVRVDAQLILDLILRL